MGVSIRYSLYVAYSTKYKFIHMCIQTKCQWYFSKNMGEKARGQWNNFQLLRDRQWKWSSLASHKYWQIGQDLDANKEIQYMGLVSINKHVSIWLCVCMCLYQVLFPGIGRCISTSMHVCACEDRFRDSSKMPSSRDKIWCWQPKQKVSSQAGNQSRVTAVKAPNMVCWPCRICHSVMAEWPQLVLGQTSPREREGPNTTKPAPGRHTSEADLLCLPCKEAETHSAYCFKWMVPLSCCSDRSCCSATLGSLTPEEMSCSAPACS